jgi:hypothetical protein
MRKMTQYVILAESAKAKIARDIIENSDFSLDNSKMNHLRPFVRKMLLEAISTTLDAVNDMNPNISVKVVDTTELNKGIGENGKKYTSLMREGKYAEAAAFALGLASPRH